MDPQLRLSLEGTYEAIEDGKLESTPSQHVHRCTENC